jgi:hypothetical protein
LQKPLGHVLRRGLAGVLQKPLGLGEISSLTGVQQVGGSLLVQATAWLDAASLSGLRCVGGIAAFADNGNLATFTGLAQWTSVNTKFIVGTPPLIVSNNAKLAASGFSALRTLAKCPTGAVSPLVVAVNATAFVGNACPKTAKSFTGVCAFAQQGSCVGVS